MTSVLKPMDSVLQLMDYVLQLLSSALQITSSGKLNLEEFTEMCRQWSLDPAKASLILKKFDKDKDGASSFYCIFR